MSTALRFPRSGATGASELARRRTRTPEGLFAPEQKKPAELILEALAELAGDEDSQFDADDQFHADLRADDSPNDFAVADAFEVPGPTRADLEASIRRNQRIVDNAATDRAGASAWGTPGEADLVDAAAQQAEVDLDAAYNLLSLLNGTAPADVGAALSGGLGWDARP